jgi:hypothetical protein
VVQEPVPGTHKVYEADPLQCPKRKDPMRVIARIEDLGIASSSIWGSGYPRLTGGSTQPERPVNAVIP